MYNDITSFYDQIFPLNQSFLAFIPAYLGEPGACVLDLGCGPGDYVDTLRTWSSPLYPKYSQALRQGIQEAGLMVLAFFADFQGSPYQPLTSPATVLTVRKVVP